MALALAPMSGPSDEDDDSGGDNGLDELNATKRIELEETKCMKNLRFSIPFICLAAFLASGCTATKNTGVAVGAGAKEAAQKVSGKATDASITAAVKMKMADDPVVSAMRINVDTTDGKVTLNGTVQNAAEADKAVDVAKSVDGVKSVESNLVVRR